VMLHSHSQAACMLPDVSCKCLTQVHYKYGAIAAVRAKAAQACQAGRLVT